MPDDIFSTDQYAPAERQPSFDRPRPGGVSVSMRDYVIDTARRLAAAGVFLAAVVHLDLWVQGFRSISTIGPLFMLDFVAGMIIGVGVLVWRHWLPALLAAGFGAATVVAFWISVIHGLFGVKETPAHIGVARQRRLDRSCTHTRRSRTTA
jgi:hypothetical protein